MRAKKIALILSILFITFACENLGDSTEDTDSQGEDTSNSEAANELATLQAELTESARLTEAAPPATEPPIPASATPVPTDPPASTDIPSYTDTPVPTDTLTPTSIPEYSWQTKSGDCKNENANVQFRNNSGNTATVSLVSDLNNRTCSYFISLASVGASWFWVEPMRYRITWTECGNTTTITNTLNSNWYFAFKVC